MFSVLLRIGMHEHFERTLIDRLLRFIYLVRIERDEAKAGSR